MLASHENLAMLRIAVAQLNPVMGDIAGNLAKARAARAEAARMQADLILLRNCSSQDIRRKIWF